MRELKVIDERIVLEKEFRIYGTVENPLFLAKDVSNWIEHTDLSRMVGLVDEDEKLKRTLYVSGQNREMWFLTEDGLYEVLMQSRKTIAKQFKKKVKEILKSIRKHGMYATDELLDNPDLLIAAATKLKEERAARLEAEKKVKSLTLINAQQNQMIGELQPKATYYDLILQNNSLLAISVIAKDYGMSGTSLNKKLHEFGVQYKLGEQWLLYAKYHDKGYTSSKTQNYSRTDGSQGSKLHTYWTQKGRLFIYELLKQNDILPLLEN